MTSGSSLKLLYDNWFETFKMCWGRSSVLPNSNQNAGGFSDLPSTRKNLISLPTLRPPSTVTIPSVVISLTQSDSSLEAWKEKLSPPSTNTNPNKPLPVLIKQKRRGEGSYNVLVAINFLWWFLQRSFQKEEHSMDKSTVITTSTSFWVIQARTWCADNVTKSVLVCTNWGKHVIVSSLVRFGSWPWN